MGLPSKPRAERLPTLPSPSQSLCVCALCVAHWVRLGRLQVSDMRQELQVNLGDGAVDLEAKEQKFLSQIMALLAETAREAESTASSSGSSGAPCHNLYV